ncbi:MAG: hypothetical protein ACRCXZ_10270 [Patescibacteria group bacterium]
MSNTISLYSFLHNHNQDLTEAEFEKFLNLGYIPLDKISSMIGQESINQVESEFLMKLWQQRDAIEFCESILKTMENLWRDFERKIHQHNAKAKCIGSGTFEVSTDDSAWYKELAQYSMRFGWVVVPQNSNYNKVVMKSRDFVS